MSACSGCGDCCCEVPLAMPMDADKALWFGLRGWDVAPLPGGRMEVTAKTPCRCFDPAADGAHCRIYERRPDFCRSYLCPDAKRGEP